MAEGELEPAPSQSEFYDDQNFEIDIDKIFNDFIQEIDAVRSYANISSFNALTIDSDSEKVDITAISKKAGMEKTVQESRCHAFFRLIGFPVVSDSGKIYNPGFDNISNPDKRVLSKNKITIASSPIDGFDALSTKRENYFKNIQQIFSNSESVNAGVLALSSGGTKKLRKFVAPLEQDPDSDPLDTDRESTAYSIDTKALVGGKEIDLKEFRDADGNPPTKFSNVGYHIIKPFIVDARIDLCVQPQSKLVAVPFVSDNSNTKVSATENVKRPLLEKIIRDRISVVDPSTTAGTAVNTTIEGVTASLNIKDDKLIKLVSSKDYYSKSTQTQFIKFLRIIHAMMTKLNKSQQTIQKTQGEYYYLPAPSNTGPEGGSSVQNVFLPTIIDSSLRTANDDAIIIAQAKNTTNNINAQAGDATAEPDVGDFALKGYTTTFGTDTSSALGDNNAQNLETLITNRTQSITAANDALRSIEIIMGEFSGFGLCDIIAIMGALSIVPENSLLGFLDFASLIRMRDSLGLNIEDVNPDTFEDSIKLFTSIVKDFYNLMDNIYQNIRENNGGS